MVFEQENQSWGSVLDFAPHYEQFSENRRRVPRQAMTLMSDSRFISSPRSTCPFLAMIPPSRVNDGPLALYRPIAPSLFLLGQASSGLLACACAKIRAFPPRRGFSIPARYGLKPCQTSRISIRSTLSMHISIIARFVSVGMFPTTSPRCIRFTGRSTKHATSILWSVNPVTTFQCICLMWSLSQ